MIVDKICNNCKIEKSLDNFSKHKFGKNGVRSICRYCTTLENKLYYINNKEKELKRGKHYYDSSGYYSKNKKQIIHRTYEYKKHKLKSNYLFKLSENIRNLIKISIQLNGNRKNSKTRNILGCDFIYFKNHIEKQFKEGMTWNNYGSWELDHIKPLMWKGEGEITEQMIIERNHHTNFQPLWKIENKRKSNKFII